MLDVRLSLSRIFFPTESDHKYNLSFQSLMLQNVKAGPAVIKKDA